MDGDTFFLEEDEKLNIETLKDTVNFTELAKTFWKKLIPMDEWNGFKIRPGFHLDNGAMVVPGGVSFTVSSQNATSC